MGWGAPLFSDISIDQSLICVTDTTEHVRYNVCRRSIVTVSSYALHLRHLRLRRIILLYFYARVRLGSSRPACATAPWLDSSQRVKRQLYRTLTVRRRISVPR